VTGSILLLTLAYVAVAVLLLNLNLATRHEAWVKGVAIVVVSMFYFGTWIGYKGLMGWPTSEAMGPDFRVLWITIEDPDKASSTPGHIYYWVRELDEAGLVAGPPRAHAVLWGEKEAEEAQRALDEMGEGRVLNGRRTRGMLAAKDPLLAASEDQAGTRSGVGQDDSPPLFEFYSIPPASLPAKEAPPLRN
jgi:hypothetical protein